MTRGELDQETRAIGRLPGVDIEVVHRPAVQERGEQISIQLTATSSFEAFGCAMERSMGTADPFKFWAQTLQFAWMPWLEAMRALSAPWMQLPSSPSNSASTPSPSQARPLPRSLPK